MSHAIGQSSSALPSPGIPAVVAESILRLTRGTPGCASAPMLVVADSETFFGAAADVARDAPVAGILRARPGDSLPLSAARLASVLVIEGGLSYEHCVRALGEALPLMVSGGVVVIGGHGRGSETEWAVGDQVPFARFLPVMRVDDFLVLQHQAEPRTLYLCGGMQSSGSTLVSMCFLQREDMDGIYDMDNAIVQQDFSRVLTPVVWAKMTIGSFRLREMAELYAAQGWRVFPLLVYRDPTDVLASLVNKPYGLDGCTGDDPPLFVRLSRYMRDVSDAGIDRWPVINYEQLIGEPEGELRRVCGELGLGWDARMLTWPMPESSFAYPSLGNMSLRNLLEPGCGLIETIARYEKRKSSDGTQSDAQARDRARSYVACYEAARLERKGADGPTISPSILRGTRRDWYDRRFEEVSVLKGYVARIRRHPVVGRVLRWWAALVNPSLARVGVDVGDADS